MEETAPQQKKVSIVTGVFVLLACIVLDLVSLIPFAGDFESIVGVIGTTIGFVMQAGTFISLTAAFVTVAKIIPVVQEFPLWSLGWIAIWIATNHPGGRADKFLEAVQVVGAIEGGEAGLAEAEGGATAAAGELGSAAEGAGQAAGGTAEGMAAGEAGSAAAPQEAGASGEESGRKSKSSRNQNGDREEDQSVDFGGGSQGQEEEEEDDDLIPQEVENPMGALQGDVSLPKEDFDDWDEDPRKKKKAA